MASSRRKPASVGYVPLRLRRDSYESELGHLASTYHFARERDSSELRDALLPVIDLPTWYVGNGGTMAVAHYAASLHNYRTGMPAFATTSLGYITSRVAARSAAVIMSAGAKHPDTAAAVRAAIERRVSRIMVITERRLEDLGGVFADPRVRVISLVRPGPNDGFLATNSVINLATAIAVGHLSASALPDELPSLTAMPDFGVRQGDDLTILATSGLWGAAIDLETRLVETGLAAVQTTDYRNFAHGRHLGLSRNQDRTTIVAFCDRQTSSLAQRTMAILPADVPVVELSSPLEEPVSCLDLLGYSMHLLGSVAAQANLDPARPEVPEFGRRLYHLKSRAQTPRLPATNPAVVQKVEVAALAMDSLHIKTYVAALRRWLRKASTTPVGAVIFDYDGTVCTTDGRFDPPDDTVQAEILRLLSLGVEVGFASGRGKSLPQGLRAWVPTELWHKVHIAVYNGAFNAALDDELLLPDQGPFTSRQTKSFIRALESRVDAVGGSVTVRPFQVSVHCALGASEVREALQVAVAEVVAGHNSSAAYMLKAFASAHSVDIVPSTTSKNSLRQRLDEAVTNSGLTLAIGDQGEQGGNDFELLAATWLSLSVDRVSGDPTRCWNLQAGTRQGPAALIRYLQAIRRDRARMLSFRWPSL